MSSREESIDRAAMMLAAAYWRGRFFNIEANQAAVEICIDALAKAHKDHWTTAASVVVDIDCESEIKRLRVLCGEAAFRCSFGPDDKGLEDALIAERRKIKYER